MKRIGVLLLAVTASVLVVQSPATAADMDCADFPSQRAAQLFFLNNNPSADPHNLDADGDGIVCESLGAPYYYGSDPTPGENVPTPKPPQVQPIKVVKVLQGDLLKLRQGAQPAYTVRLLGAEVRGNSCLKHGARRDLQRWIRPGRVVRIDSDRKAPRRDPQGHVLADVVTVQGGYTIGGSQVSDGWAMLPTYRFGERSRYQRWADEAEYSRSGYYGNCVANFGSEAHPYNVGTAFDLGLWRYQFAATDDDAWPDMQAEKAAAPGSIAYVDPPKAGWAYVRTLVTVTRIGSGSGAARAVRFGLRRSGVDYSQFDDTFQGWCGTGAQYIDDQMLSEGQSFSGYICASVPAPLSAQDTWIVDTDDFEAERSIAVR